MSQQRALSLPNIGYRLRLARHRAGLSREVLAARCGVDEPTISRWENDLAHPTHEQMQKAAPLLNTTVAWLLNDKNEAGPYSPWFFMQAPIFDAAYGNPKVDINIRKQKGLIGYLNTNAHISEQGFGLRLDDDSMSPEIRRGDHILIDPAMAVNPGDFVAAQVPGEPHVLVRKFRPRTFTKGRYVDIDLSPLNDDWPTIKLTRVSPGTIIGPVIEVRHQYKISP